MARSVKQNQSEVTTQASRTLPDHDVGMPEQEDDDFTFPTPPPPPQHLADAAFRYGHRYHNRSNPSPSSSPPPPAWLQLSWPIRRSFSAADCAASPWQYPRRGGGAYSPALSDYAAVFYDGDEEEEAMDSIWEDLNDEETPVRKEDLFLVSYDVSRRRSVGGADPVERRKAVTAAKEREAAVLAASWSSRRRSPGLIVMMRALKKMFVAHKSSSKVHRVDEQSTTASASSFSNSGKK